MTKDVALYLLMQFIKPTMVLTKFHHSLESSIYFEGKLPVWFSVTDDEKRRRAGCDVLHEGAVQSDLPLF